MKTINKRKTTDFRLLPSVVGAGMEKGGTGVVDGDGGKQRLKRMDVEACLMWSNRTYLGFI